MARPPSLTHSLTRHHSLQVAKGAENLRKKQRDAIKGATGGKQALKRLDKLSRDQRKGRRGQKGAVGGFQLTGWVALASMLSLAAVVVVLLYVGVRALMKYTNCCKRSEASRKNVTYNAV